MKIGNLCMAGLEFRFLGDFEVRKDGQALPLPPSKKTRALLAYLSLSSRRFRREYLCQLLWEIPDDPRGSLRWSLSKIRRLVDDDGRARVLADRDSVGFDADGISIDMRELRQLVAAGLTKIPIDEVEAAAARYRGNVLEGLEFSSFHDFHTWCVTEREQSLHDQAALLTELVKRLADAPERAIRHARALVGLSPYEEAHRATLIRLLNAARQFGEAEEQYQLGLRMLKEAGIRSSGAMLAARRAPRIDAPPQREPVAARPESVAVFRHGLFGREAVTVLIAEALVPRAGARPRGVRPASRGLRNGGVPAICALDRRVANPRSRPPRPAVRRHGRGQPQSPVRSIERSGRTAVRRAPRGVAVRRRAVV